jgi:antitoxin (DNA-binding transcriptional repressor) of toxin-antitoxin stability system
MLDEVARTRSVVVITKRGRPVAKLVPCSPTPSACSLAGSILEERGDPFDTAEPWDADAS